MLNENIKALRQSKGLSQQELAVKLNVVRQTVSKWETGLSVPDSDLLIALSDALEVPVSTLLGESVMETEVDTIKALSEKLEIINLQLARRKALRRNVFHWSLIALCVVIVAISAALVVINSPYLGWDFSNPEIAVVGTAFHAFEWLFVRLAPMVLIAAIAGIYLTRKKHKVFSKREVPPIAALSPQAKIHPWLKSSQRAEGVVLFCSCILYDHLSSCRESINQS